MAKDLASFKERNQSNAMGRDRIAAEVATRLDISRGRARVMLDTTLDVIQEAMEAKKRVELRGFGTLLPHRRNTRRSFVPTKGKVVKVDAKWVVVFKTSKELKKRLMETLEG